MVSTAFFGGFLLGTASELVVQVTWIMLRVTVGSSGYEMTLWWLFWGFKSRHLVDYCVHNSSVYPLTDDDDSNVTSLLAFTIMI